jgi:Undecaprenyl-phosphate galactose phosphotransferase WbaP
VLLRDANTGLRPVLLTVPDDKCRTSLLPVINDPAILKSAISARKVRHAVVSMPDLSATESAKLLDRYSGVVPHLLVLSDYSTLPTLWSTSRRCGRLCGIEVRNGLKLATLQFVKRCIDVTISMAALFFLSPLLVVVAILVKRSSPGPLFYGHGRIGQHGRRFKAWKFRTMRVNADAVLKEYLAANPEAKAEWDRHHKLRDDPRVTRFGRIARRLSFDEFPQLWNVLRGDMSLVGPRPIIDAEVCRYRESFLLYASVKPGITGMWQVSGRNDIDYDDRVRLDEFYIRHWSPWLDIYILAKTLVALVSRDGAY